MQRFLWLLLLLLLWFIRHSLFLFWSRYFCMSITMGIALRARDSLWPKLTKSITASRELTIVVNRAWQAYLLSCLSCSPSLSLSACLSMNLVFLLRACNYSWARRERGEWRVLPQEGRLSKAEHLLHKLKLKSMCGGQSNRNIYCAMYLNIEMKHLMRSTCWAYAESENALVKCR